MSLKARVYIRFEALVYSLRSYEDISQAQL